MATFSLLFYIHFKNRVKVYLQYTSLLNSWLTQIYLKHTFQYFHKVANFDCMLISCHVCIRVNPHSTDAWMPRNSLLETGVISVSDCNGAGTHNHLVGKQTLNHLAKLVESLEVKISNSILEVYFIFRLQKYIWSIQWCIQAVWETSTLVWASKNMFQIVFFSVMFQQNIHWRSD